MTTPVEEQRLQAMFRLLLEAGEITPMGVRQLRRLLMRESEQ